MPRLFRLSFFTVTIFSADFRQSASLPLPFSLYTSGRTVRLQKRREKTPPFFRQWSSNGRQKKTRLPEIKKAPPVKLPMESYFLVVPEAGLEPARSCPRQILSLMRLPFRHSGALMTYCITRAEFQSIGSRTMCATSRRRAVSVWSQKMGVRVTSPRCAQ